MKKAKFLALALAGAITLMGAGYAAWTDNITLKSTVSTGVLDLHYDTTINAPIIKDYVKITPIYDVDNVGNNPDNTGQYYSDIANLKVENMYPGATASYELKLINRSTIPVKFDSIITENKNFPGDLSGVVSKIIYTDPKNVEETLEGAEINDFASAVIKEGTSVFITYTISSELRDKAASYLQEEKSEFYLSTITVKFKQFNAS